MTLALTDSELTIVDTLEINMGNYFSLSVLH
jgi:hypothetical protein